jgi:hypothetical protein
MKQEWFEPIIKRDGGFICFYCKKTLSLTNFVHDHLNDNRKDNRIENIVHACFSCNNKKKNDFDMQLSAASRLQENEDGNSMRERISPKQRELKELDISKENYEIAEDYITREVDQNGSILVKDAKHSISYICRKTNGTGSPQAVSNYINTLTSSVAPFEIIKNEKGKKIIQRSSSSSIIVLFETFFLKILF